MNESEISNILAEDPGNPVFCEYAEKLRQEGKLKDALWVTLSGLSKNPANHRGRLVMARTLYQAGFIDFSVTELKVISKELPENQSVKKLIDKLAPGEKEHVVEKQSEQASHGSGEDTLAESEFDLGDLEMIEDE